MSPASSQQRRPIGRGDAVWLALHLGLGLLWIGILASLAAGHHRIGANGLQVVQILLPAGWLPSIGLACWQVRHRRWRPLLLSDLLAGGLLVLVAFTAYLPLFFFNVAWFVPLAILPRGILSECLVRGLALWRR